MLMHVLSNHKSAPSHLDFNSSAIRILTYGHCLIIYSDSQHVGKPVLRVGVIPMQSQNLQ
jgi:hypothetical protein